MSAWRCLPALCCLLCLLAADPAPARAELSHPAVSLGQRASVVLERIVGESRELARLIAEARAVLVFPEVVPMTFGEGGQYGEGALLVAGSVVAHYAATGAEPPELPAGVLHRTDVLLFMTDEALWDFRNQPVWQLGRDGRVGLLETDRPGRWSEAAGHSPVLGFGLAGPALSEPLRLANNTLSRIR